MQRWTTCWYFETSSEYLTYIDCVEALLGTTKFASHLDLAALGQNALRLFLTQSNNHFLNPLATASAEKMRRGIARRTAQTSEFLLPEQTSQDGVTVKRQEFIALQT